MLDKGTIVRGSWSRLRYRVEHCGEGDAGWWVTGRDPDNPRSTGSFSGLGARVGYEVHFVDPERSGDRLLILREPVKMPSGQLELSI